MWKIVILTILATVNGQGLYQLKASITWNTIDYAFPDNVTKEDYIKKKEFIPENNIPIGISIWKDKMLVAIPKWREGVVSTLNYIPLSAVKQAETRVSPKLIPYPDWPYDETYAPNGNKIISTLHARPDACGRLWLIDLGKENLLEGIRQVGPSSIIVIDLETDKIIRNHTITTPSHKDRTFFAEFVVDVDPKNCNDAHMYISDPQDLGIVVYSYAKDKTWRFDHNFFGPDPLWGDLNVTGVNLHWHDGVLSLALSPPLPDGSKTLYFHAVASIDEFSVSTAILKDEEKVKVDHYYYFNRIGSRGLYSQALTAHMDTKTKILFFPLINQHAIACWNTAKPLSPLSYKIVAQDPETLAFLTDLIIDLPNNRLYALASNFPSYIKKSYKPYIVFSEDLRKLSTPCL